MRTGATILSLCLVLLSGCGGGGSAVKTETGSADSTEDQVEPAERPYYDAGKPFYLAIAAREYDKAYELLASYARIRVSLSQLTPPSSDEEERKLAKISFENGTAAQFAEALKKVEGKFGQPKKLDSLSVYSTDPAVLSRTSTDQFGNLDSMFAIGAMPDSIPKNIRKASLRGRINTQLSDAELEKVAKEQNTTVQELKDNEDFQPYFNLKVVLVEESGELKVGYFEFLAPSMLD